MRTRETHNDASEALFRVAVLLEVLRDGDEDARRQGHVKYTVRLLLVLFEVAEVRFELLEALVLVVLAGNVGTHAAELLELLLHLLGGSLDVRLDALQVLGVVHLCTCVTNNLDILGEEVVTVLKVKSVTARCREL